MLRKVSGGTFGASMGGTSWVTSVGVVLPGEELGGRGWGGLSSSSSWWWPCGTSAPPGLCKSGTKFNQNDNLLKKKIYNIFFSLAWYYILYKLNFTYEPYSDFLILVWCLSSNISYELLHMLSTRYFWNDCVHHADRVRVQHLEVHLDFWNTKIIEKKGYKLTWFQQTRDA